MIDPLGFLVSELRTAGIASGRVRGAEPAPASEGYEGDALGPGDYKRFVVLSRLSTRRLPRTPIQTVRIGVKAYGATFQDASALVGEVSDAISNIGPRLSGSGVAIYRSQDGGGGGASRDPDTDQPYEDATIVLIAGTASVPSGS